MARRNERIEFEPGASKEPDRRDTDSVDEDFIDARNKAVIDDIKPSDSVSQKGDISNDDATSVAPTLVAPSIQPAAAPASKSSSRPDKFTSTGDICFSLGRDSHYFLFLKGGKLKGGNLSVRQNDDGPSLRAMKTLEYQHVYMHSFSPHGDEFCVFENKYYAISWSFHAAKKSKITYRSLRDWLLENLDVQSRQDILKSRVVFGEGASFFASNGEICIHNDLPTRLSNEIEKRQKGDDGVLPDILSLGAEQTYFARWPRTISSGKANAIWALNPDCALRPTVSSHSFRCADYAYIFLSPVDSTHYVAVSKSGMVEYQIVDPNGSAKDHFKAYMQLQAREKQTTFNIMFTTGTGSKTEEVTYISAETNYEMPKSTGKKGKAKVEGKEKDGLKPSGSNKKKRFGLFGRKGET